jgi:hypothetical protein
MSTNAQDRPRIRNWVGDFLGRHRARFNPADWPEAGCDEWYEYVKGWIKAFALKAITEAEADEASQHLTLVPPKWRLDHIPAVVRQVEALRAERHSIPVPPAAPPPADDPLPPETWARYEALWDRLEEADREQWRAAVRERFPLMPEPFVGPLACWWCNDPQQVPPLAPPAPERPAGLKGPRHAFAGYDPAIGVPAAHADV